MLDEEIYVCSKSEEKKKTVPKIKKPLHVKEAQIEVLNSCRWQRGGFALNFKLGNSKFKEAFLQEISL